MSWIQIIFYLLINAPKIVALVREIINLIKNAPGSRDALSIRERIAAAIEEHKKDKDDEKLGKMCLGIGCPPQLAK